jgi:hypothetical protein
MSIEFINDLERDLELGREIWCCPGVGQKQWVFSKEGIESLRKVAQRSANGTKMQVQIGRLAPRYAVSSNTLLVPTSIGDPGPRGEPMIKWALVESKEAAEMLRDIRYGPAPFFIFEVEDTVDPFE